MDVEYGDIIRFAVPVFIGRSVNVIVAFVCRIIASQMGVNAFNGINIGLMVFFLIQTVLTAVGIGSTVLVAQHWGRGDQEGAGKIIKQSLVLGCLISLIFSAIGLLSNSLFCSSLKSNAETITHISSFFFWLFIFLPVITPGVFLTAALRGAGDFKTPMKASFTLGVLSFFLFYCLSLGKFGFPRLEASGSALSLIIAYGVYSLILIFKVFLKRTVLRLPRGGWLPKMHLTSRMLKIGIPSASEWLILRMGMFILVFVVIYYGEAAMAGYFAGISFLTMAYAMNFGFQAASTTMVGQAVGSGDQDRAKTVLKKTMHLSFMFMVLMAIALYFVSEDILSFMFSELDAESIHNARIYILTLMPVIPLMGISFVLVGGIRGTGNTIPPLVATSIGVLGGRIGLAFLIYFLFHPPLYIIWLTPIIDILIRILILLPRVRNLKQRKRY